MKLTLANNFSPPESIRAISGVPRFGRVRAIAQQLLGLIRSKVKVRGRVLAALSIGSRQTTCLIIELRDHRNPAIIGFGQCLTGGMVQGVVNNYEKTAKAVAECLRQARKMARVSVDSVSVAISGKDIGTRCSSGEVPVSVESDRDNSEVITEFTIQRAKEVASAVSLPGDLVLLEIIPISYAVDSQSGILNPLGLEGVRLSLNALIVVGADANIRKIYQMVEDARMHLDTLAFKPASTCEALVFEAEKEVGVCVVDIGSDITDVTFIRGGAVQKSTVLCLGGDIFTSDISKKVGVSFSDAEKIKIAYGHCQTLIADAETLDLQAVINRRPRETLGRRELGNIIRDRAKEIIWLLSEIIRDNGGVEVIPAGIVFTGGGCNLEGFLPLAEEKLGVTARMGRIEGLEGPEGLLGDPGFSAAAGLAIRESRGRLARVEKGFFHRLCATINRFVH